MAAEKSKSYRIGYALPPTKVETVVQPSLISLAKEHDIELVPVDLTKPLIDQSPVHCIIHKIYDPEWTEQLKQFHVQCPDVVIMDHPEAIERLHNRNTMLEVAENLKISGQVSVAVPKQVFVESSEPLSECVKVKSMKFPVIAKTLLANANADSHKMCLVFEEDGLKDLELKPPFVFQEFINHGGVVFKVYVAGEHVQCEKRRSLPDVSEEKLPDSKKLLSFAEISSLSAGYQSDDEDVLRLIKSAELPPSSFVNEVAGALRQGLGLNLFNFDMIKGNGAEEGYYVIDINYLPGYAKIPNYEKMLIGFFLDVLKQKQNEVCNDGERV